MRVNCKFITIPIYPNIIENGMRVLCGKTYGEILWRDNYSKNVPHPLVKVTGIDGLKFRTNEIQPVKFALISDEKIQPGDTIIHNMTSIGVAEKIEINGEGNRDAVIFIDNDCTVELWLDECKKVIATDDYIKLIRKDGDGLGHPPKIERISISDVQTFIETDNKCDFETVGKFIII